ncbi:MAG: hypothetical protein HY761_10265 [Candidatus Omnitrophica bacterium]|nr:hypothetical protein [Candidatus Omnitrophota bacterium]
MDLINNIIKSLIVFFAVVFLTAGSAQSANQDILLQDNNEQPKEGLTENDNTIETEPAFGGASFDNIPLVSDVRVTNITDTVSGLKKSGYSLDTIASFLKNDEQSASDISIACLREGYNGMEIFNALQNAGFSERECDAAVPKALRTQGQFLSIFTKINADSDNDNSAVISPNPFTKGVLKSDTMVSSNADNSSNGSVINPIEVPVSVGVTFNGLGNWNAFQDERHGINK